MRQARYSFVASSLITRDEDAALSPDSASSKSTCFADDSAFWRLRSAFLFLPSNDSKAVFAFVLVKASHSVLK
jgi:hypothetical protein